MLKLKPRETKTKKGGVTKKWQIVGTCPYTGQPVRKSTWTSDRAIAENKLAIHLAKAREEALHGKRVDYNFADAVVEYLSFGGSEAGLDPLLEHFGQMRLNEIDSTDLSDYQRTHHPKWKPATAKRWLYAPMQAVFNKAAKLEMCPYVKFEKPKVAQKTIPGVTDEWLMLLLRDLNTIEQKCCILFMSFSGARSSEACGVLGRHYKPDLGTVLMGKTKNGEPRHIHLPVFVNEAMKLLSHKSDDDPIFGYSHHSSIKNFVKRACARSGLEYFTPHQIGRHTFAERFLRDKHTLRELQDAGGWKSTEAVMKYAHLEQTKVDDAVRNVTTKVTLDGVTETKKIAQFPHSGKTSNFSGARKQNNNKGEASNRTA